MSFIDFLGNGIERAKRWRGWGEDGVAQGCQCREAMGKWGGQYRSAAEGQRRSMDASCSIQPFLFPRRAPLHSPPYPRHAVCVFTLVAFPSPSRQALPSPIRELSARVFLTSLFPRHLSATRAVVKKGGLHREKTSGPMPSPPLSRSPAFTFFPIVGGRERHARGREDVFGAGFRPRRA